MGDDAPTGAEERRSTVYEAVGADFFVTLVAGFYEGVASDPVLRPMYPDDLEGARERLALFLVQYWGGPTTYSDRRGHPRLRMRHMPYRVDIVARDAWVGHMLASLRRTVDATGAPAEVEAVMADYFVGTADFLRNVLEVRG
ncbi:MAG: globin [Acidimicrobiales bacterium]